MALTKCQETTTLSDEFPIIVLGRVHRYVVFVHLCPIGILIHTSSFPGCDTQHLFRLAPNLFLVDCSLAC